MSAPKLSNESNVLESGGYDSSIVKVNEEKKSSYLFAKRCMDVLGAAVGLILIAPIFGVIAILIKMEDPKGPVFFKQRRVGKYETVFEMYKFRSMVSNAEELLDGLLNQNEVSGHMFKMKYDPRITKVGRFIRKTSLDELPQLWNVLKGDMSLVGPRPPLPREVKEYTAYHRQRLQVTPGCTGLWQVSGRNQLGFEQMVELDIQYIASRSLLFDMKIIFKTMRVLLGSKDAF
ncbi:exopolysaccharide biosynthesis polyprenyl glycosylphosphotransferase [Paenibacillus tianmuensis]|uniref:Exopolysaccharide biosynthesis polyprenyl glycosylphosphotransferase n=1 Tax=Paenibacillus tianmuensis TaxID=624147 RepID=A0A1G4R5K9_9BACL|nr:sugar transferase [Paenibacillus tianmuensis]SCW52130.1 exopolysaccharide biosynthesis polyprenyl glycosylphosphotransferase [Paenibacillus tianmuensis]